MGEHFTRPLDDDGFLASLNTDVTDCKPDDPVCIVGLACRLPGDIQSPSELWDFIMERKSAQGPVPAMRFNMKGFYHPDRTRAGVMSADGGYFIQRDVREFENTFFGINNLEATYMDPQQRQLLEVVYECLEHAGVPLDRLSGTNTGVYVGNFTMDFQTMQTRDPDYGSRYTATGTGTAILANRISHTFNLHGPSFTLDTACSSSIYCLHNAVRAIQSGDCESAIVAAANLITSPEQHLGTMKGGVLSPTSTCHTFDISADGYGRAEGVNAIYLKRLSAAITDGDKIWSVIRGTAINANGKTTGIAQPNANLQEAVIRKAYANAGLEFDDTDYVECHGTGTAVGDPIEVDSIASCFGPRRGTPLMIGSVKTNLGHSEAASGLTSIIKVSLAFDNNRIPPTHGVKTLNPKLKLEERNFKVVTEAEAWPRELHRASINSFGYGGANAHVVLESARSYILSHTANSRPSKRAIPRIFVLPVSAQTQKSLKLRMDQVRRVARSSSDDTIERLAHTLTQRRTSLRFKRFLLLQKLPDGSYDTISEPTFETADFATTIRLPFAFIFTGQGAQYAEMAKGLLISDKTFLDTIRELDHILKGLDPAHRPEWSLEQTILDPAEDSQINQVARSQPLCTAVQIGLLRMLQTYGIRASAVVGHSSGEIAAACAAGLLTESQAIKVAYFRGYAVDRLTTVGAMIAVGLGVAAARDAIREKDIADQVCIACVNSPESVTLSGDSSSISILKELLKSQGCFVRELHTGGRAYHSYMMQEIGALYEQLLTQYLGNTSNGPLKARMFSSVGETEDSLRIFENCFDTSTYWRENLVRPVQFNGALRNLVAEKQFHLIELGPHSALKGPVQQIRAGLGFSQHQLPYNSTLTRNLDANLCMRNLAGHLSIAGYTLDWAAVNELPKSGLSHLHDLPTYPWDYPDVLFHEPRASSDLRQRQHIRHELLGSKQLAGDGVQWSWRNILRLSEMPWMQGHKVENQVVFPATGYLAVSMEALSQILGLNRATFGKSVDSNTIFDFARVNIAAALVLQPDDETGKNTIELHTTMSPRRISTASTSSEWYDFTIVSWIAGQSTVHCTGGLRVICDLPQKSFVEVSQAEEFELWTPDPWYAKGKTEGLWFEDQFKSLTSLRTDGNRIRPEGICTTQLVPPCAKDPDALAYALHPITVDACLQAAIMGSTAGNLASLRAYLPVFITKAQIRALVRVASDEEEARIHTRSTQTGLATQRIDATLYDAAGTVMVNLMDIRLALYTSRTTGDSALTDSRLPRYPCLRTSWKPDITRLNDSTSSQYGDYFREFTKKSFPGLESGTSIAVMAGLVDLVAHKNPLSEFIDIRIDAASCEEKGIDFGQLLGTGTDFPRCSSYQVVGLDALRQADVRPPGGGTFDVVVLRDEFLAQQFDATQPEILTSLVGDNGIVIGINRETFMSQLRLVNWEIVEVPGDVFIARPSRKNTRLGSKDVFVVVRSPSTAVSQLVACLMDCLQEHNSGMNVRLVSLDQMDGFDLSKESICISMIEVEHELLASMGEAEMRLLRRITDNVSELLWLTGAGMLSGNPHPDLTLSGGLSRALMLEQPSLKFSVLDIGPIDATTTNVQSTCCNITMALTQESKVNDKEFVQKDGLMYISRFVSYPTFNDMFERCLTGSGRVKLEPLGSVLPAKLAISSCGQLDSIHYEQLTEPNLPVPADYIEVEVMAFSINAKDVYALNGRVETRAATIGNEFSGVVKSVGPNVSRLQPGDRVVVMAPNHLKTTERVPIWAAQKLLPGEEFTTMASLPVVYASAMYALHDRARLRARESILIHSGTGGLGLALIDIAQRLGAIVYTTVGSPEKREYVRCKLGIKDSHIFSSRDATFVDNIMTRTGGRGVQVVVNSLVGDLMHASWDCIAPFGRFVEVGKKELTNAGQLNMHAFLKNATFTAFDIADLFYQEDSFYHEIWSSKMTETLALYRSGQMSDMPRKVFKAGEITAALRYFSLSDRIGKVIVSLEDRTTSIPVAPAKYQTRLDPDKTYLLVGCLGGLGRSLSRWMLGRGARRFCFLGRSGADKPAAQALVRRLRAIGAVVEVVRGDVSQMSDVVSCVKASKNLGGPIGGVVQAAMGLHEALFSRMSNTAWQTSIQPKWAGSWNLHHALQGEPLDFFLLTSSMSGSVGTATESNYCAANGFLDAFAHWRRSQGLPAVSVGLGMISEVGYLHENPEIEALLLRKGIQPLNEDEFLQVIDMSLSAASLDESTEPHVLTGLEPFGFRRLMALGFDVDFEVVQDARMAILSAAVAADQKKYKRAAGWSQLAALDRSHLEATAPWFKTVPDNLFAVFSQEPDAQSLHQAALSLTRKRFSNLILMPVDQIDDSKPISQFGVDSMIAAELRTWLWNSFKVDVPFLDLLSPQKDLNTLAAFVADSVVKADASSSRS
uniref:Polyketide synthase n=1 Tax=Pestalotiopsis microspora TaxID=85828 RepID=A0A1P8NTJ2_PESMI|nr:polyketide synthase [Pestalotiopsis microspora]